MNFHNFLINYKNTKKYTMYNTLKRVYSITAVILPITFLVKKFCFFYILTRKYNKFDKIKTL